MLIFISAGMSIPRDERRTTIRGRFTGQQLYELRNNLPVRYVIESVLNISNRVSGDVFRFECPICSGWHTGVKYEKNLARCFDCRANFNPIDLAIRIRQEDFYPSASFLWDLYQSFRNPPPNELQAPVTHARAPEPARTIQAVKFKPIETDELISIGSILGNFGFPQSGGDKQCSALCWKMESQIEQLEKDVIRLKNQVAKLEKFVIATSGIKSMRKKKEI